MRVKNVFRDPRIVTGENASSIEKKCQTTTVRKLGSCHFPQKRSRTNRETHWGDHEENYSLVGYVACERNFFALRAAMFRGKQKRGKWFINKQREKENYAEVSCETWRIREPMKSKRAVITRKSCEACVGVRSSKSIFSIDTVGLASPKAADVSRQRLSK